MKKTALNKLRSKLPTGWRAKLAEKLKVGEDHISKVLNGHRDDLEVITAAIEMVKDEEARASDLEAEIGNLNDMEV